MNRKFLETTACGVITWLMIFVMAFLTINSFFFRSYIDVTYVETIHYRKDNALLALLFLAGMAALLYVGIKKGILAKIPEKPLLAVLLVYVAALSGLWAYATHSIPSADQKSILDCTDGLIHGNYECMTYKGYLQYNRHQVGLTAFYEIFTRLFTGGKISYGAIYGMNTLMITGIFFELYLITKELTDKKETVILELLLSFGMFQLMLYSTFAYGLIPGLFFGLAGFFFLLRLLKTGRWQNGALMALMFALSVVLKSNYLIFVIAGGIVLTGKAVSEKKVSYLLFLLLAVAGFLSINAAAQKTYEVRTGMEFGDTIPNSAYLAMAMQNGDMAPGWFNGFNHVTYRLNDYDEEVTDQISKDYIRQRIGEFAKDPLECLDFYYHKIVSQWNEVTYECFWISAHKGNHSKELSGIVQNLYTGKLHTLAEAVMNLYQLFLFFGTFLCAWGLQKNKDLSKTILLLCILGGFLFHILWEGKSQYIISYFPLMLPCTVIGLEMAGRRIHGTKETSLSGS